MNIKRRRCSNEKSPSELLLRKPLRYWPSEIQMTSEKQITTRSIAGRTSNKNINTVKSGNQGGTGDYKIANPNEGNTH